MKVKIPKPLRRAIRSGLVLSIIQFGSSLRRSKYQDIDLAVIIKREAYKEFLNIVYGENFQEFDISLIKEEEIENPDKFRFGGHGAHFLFSLTRGKILYGEKNFLEKFKVNNFDKKIKHSIFLRLFDYVEDVRRAVFLNISNDNIKRRWPKFLRLSLYLLEKNNNLKYPDLLDIKEEEIKKHLKRHNINIYHKNLQDHKNLLISYEEIWEKVLKKQNLTKNKKHKKT